MLSGSGGEKWATKHSCASVRLFAQSEYYGERFNAQICL